MTVIAWDGTKLAVDRMASNDGYAYPVNKLVKTAIYVYAWSGSYDSALSVIKWHMYKIKWEMDGYDDPRYPKCQETDRMQLDPFK